MKRQLRFSSKISDTTIGLGLIALAILCTTLSREERQKVIIIAIIACSGIILLMYNLFGK